MRCKNCICNPIDFGFNAKDFPPECKVYYPILENWSVGVPNPNPYLPPEAQVLHLQGKVHGHPNFADGDQITTSAIVSHDYSRRLVSTRNRTYRLGTIDPNYVRFMEENNIVPTTFDPKDFL